MVEDAKNGPCKKLGVEVNKAMKNQKKKCIKFVEPCKKAAGKATGFIKLCNNTSPCDNDTKISNVCMCASTTCEIGSTCVNGTKCTTGKNFVVNNRKTKIK